MNRKEYLTRAREYARRGTDLDQAKLDAATVKKIREASARKKKLIKLINAKYTAKALARKYKVHYRTIEKVLSYETWVHVK